MSNARLAGLKVGLSFTSVTFAALAALVACGADGEATGEPNFAPPFTGSLNGTGGSPANPATNVPSTGNGGSGSGQTGEGQQGNGVPVVPGSNTAGNGQGGTSGNTPPASGQGGAAGNTSVPPGNGGQAGAPNGQAGAPNGQAGAPNGQAGAPNNPPPVLPTPPGTAFFFDDFEGGTVGQQPAAWDRWINYSVEAGNVLGNPQFALLDDSEAFRGEQSVHFHTTGATQPAMLSFTLPANLSRVFIRAFVKSSIQVGGVAADSVSNHETLIALRATPNDGNFELRFGGAKGALGFNIVGPGRNDAVSPQQAQWGSGPGLTANTWRCIEIAFDNSNPSNPTASASMDGTVVRSVTNDWHVGISQQWLSGMFNEVVIGWQSFSPAPANDVWMDDVVLSSDPIGCN